MQTNHKFVYILLPILLTIITSIIFHFASLILGIDWGYLTGFMFYYLIWCILIPLIITGKSFLSFFKDGHSLLKMKNWWIIILFLSTLAAPVFMYFIPKLPEAVPAIIILAAPLSIIHGICEELFWRGLYIKQFPDSIIWSVIIPSVMFSLWHIAPQFSIRSEHPFIFIISTVPLGLTYAITAYATKSAKWPAIGHAFSTFMAFSLPISSSLYNIIK